MNPSDESKEPQTSESSDTEATFTPSEKIRNQEQHSKHSTPWKIPASFFLKSWIVLLWWVRSLWKGHKFKADSRFDEIKYERSQSSYSRVKYLNVDAFKSTSMPKGIQGLQRFTTAIQISACSDGLGHSETDFYYTNNMS